MSILEMRTYGDPFLRKKTIPLERINSQVKEIVHSMIETMRISKGVGLAANQVGFLEKICVIDTSKGEKKEDLLVLVNPEIINKSGKIKLEEGCLSFPEITEEIERASKVKIKALNLEGKEIQVIGENLLARVLQHEIDHLNGVLFIDYLHFVRKLAIQKKLNELKKLYER
ncbi:MAG: peptide deformylase [Candidatus Firestonebacteria bacterium]